MIKSLSLPLLLVSFWGCVTQGQQVTIEKGNLETWYTGPSFLVTHPDFPDYDFYFWPQEAWASSNHDGGDWEFIESQHIDTLWTDTSGVTRYKSQDLFNPDVTFLCAIEPMNAAISVTYTFINNSSDSLWISTNPCFQLDPKLFEDVPDEERSTHVFISTAEGLITMDQTARNPGSRANAPWTQIYIHEENPFRPGNHGFGLSDDAVDQGIIGLDGPNSDLSIVLACEQSSSVAFAFLNCLHADVGKWCAPQSESEVAYKIYFGTDLGKIGEQLEYDFEGLSFDWPK